MNGREGKGKEQRMEEKEGGKGRASWGEVLLLLLLLEDANTRWVSIKKS